MIIEVIEVIFWLGTLIVFPFGTTLSVFGGNAKKQSLGIFVIITGIVFVLLPLGYHDNSSYEYDLALTILATVGPSILMGTSTLLMIFTSRSPIKPLPRIFRWIGWSGLLGGMGWCLLLAIKNPPVTHEGVVSPIWTNWLMAFIATALTVSLAAIIFLISMGRARYTEVIILLPIPIGAGWILNYSLTEGTRGLAPEVALQRFAEAGLTLLGSLIGFAITILAFGFLLLSVERSRSQPPIAAELSKEEKQILQARVIKGKDIISKLTPTEVIQSDD